MKRYSKAEKAWPVHETEQGNPAKRLPYVFEQAAEKAFPPMMRAAAPLESYPLNFLGGG
jgi:hypothetical protein